MLERYGLVATKAKSVEPGMRFGRLTVLATGQKPGSYRYYAICQCDCGTAPSKVRMDGLTSGAVVGCGCVRLERSSTHGLSTSGHYDRWKNMISRCEDPADPAYANYGGRGINVCDRWHSLENFVADLPDGHFAGAHLDRIDNNGNYEPGNVRWVTPRDNFRNRRSARIIECFGKRKSLTEWAEETGIDRRVLHTRLGRLGWSAERALTKGARK